MQSREPRYFTCLCHCSPLWPWSCRFPCAKRGRALLRCSEQPREAVLVMQLVGWWGTGFAGCLASHHLHGTSVWRSREASEVWDQCQTLPAAKGSVLRHTHECRRFGPLFTAVASHSNQLDLILACFFVSISVFFLKKKCVVYLRIMSSSLGTSPASPVPVGLTTVSAVGARGDPS